MHRIPPPPAPCTPQPNRCGATLPASCRACGPATGEATCSARSRGAWRAAMGDSAGRPSHRPPGIHDAVHTLAPAATAHAAGPCPERRPVRARRTGPDRAGRRHHARCGQGRGRSRRRIHGAARAHRDPARPVAAPHPAVGHRADPPAAGRHGPARDVRRDGPGDRRARLGDRQRAHQLRLARLQHQQLPGRRHAQHLQRLHQDQQRQRPLRAHRGGPRRHRPDHRRR